MAAGLPDCRLEPGTPDHRCPGAWYGVLVMAHEPYSSDPMHAPVPRRYYTRISDGSQSSMRACSPLEKTVHRSVPFVLLSCTATNSSSGGGPCRRRRGPRRRRGSANNAWQTSSTTCRFRQSRNATCGLTGAPVGKSSYTRKAGERNMTMSPTTGI